ncbi:MAG: MATE family efflux transporter [Clostridia bacterium]|nr:MATE family efflux transporter [Clostridia bacterium]
MSKTLTADFTTGNIPKQLFKFATPLFLSSLLQVVYNMVDMIVVGRVMGETGLSAVSIGGDVCNFLTFVAMGFSNAGQVIIAKYIGAGKKEKVGRFITTMFTALSIGAVALGALCLALRRPILQLMNTPQAAFEQALGYSVVCMVGMVFIYGYNTLSAVLRGIGDAKHPFIFISIAALLNVALDLLFVVVLSWGAAGAALATVISQGVSFVACGIFLYRRRNSLGFDLPLKDFWRMDKELFGELCKLGIPMAIKSAAIHISKLFVNSWINSYGVAVSAFAGIANKINSISNLISNSLNTAGSSMVGQNIGAKTYHRVPRIAAAIGVSTLTIATVLSLVFYAFPEPIFSIFIKAEEREAVLKIAMEYLPIAVAIFFGSACRAPANAIINGSGNYKVNFATAILDGIVMRIGLSLLFGLGLQMHYVGFWLGDALAGFTPMVIGIVFYLTGKWKK